MPLRARTSNGVLAVADLKAGDRISIYDSDGEIVELFEHGRMIGDGTVEWRTLRVLFEDERHSSTGGPLRCDRQVAIR